MRRALGFLLIASGSTACVGQSNLSLSRERPPADAGGGAQDASNPIDLPSAPDDVLEDASVAPKDMTSQEDEDLNTPPPQDMAEQDMAVADVMPDVEADVPDPQDMSMDMPQDMGPPPGTIPVIVGLGWKGLSMVSIDEGQTWCQTGVMSDGHDDLYRGGGYHDGLWVGGHAGRANRGAIIISRIGYEWTALHKTNTDDSLPDNPTNQWCAGADYLNGTWVAAGGCGQWMTSPDGINWTRQDRFVTGCLHIRSIAAGGGQLIVGDNDSRWWTSSDAQTWTRLDGDRGSQVVWTGQDFEEGSRHRGRGICLWTEGFNGRSRIMRSPNTDCDQGVEVAMTDPKLNDYLFGYAPAADYEFNALPRDLAQCLGIQAP